VVAIPGWLERSRYIAGEGPLLVSPLYPPPMNEHDARARRVDLISIDESGEEVQHPTGPAKRRYDLGFRFEVGMVYTVIAGLLNLLVVYDAHSGPMLAEEEKNDGDGSAPGESSD